MSWKRIKFINFWSNGWKLIFPKSILGFLLTSSLLAFACSRCAEEKKPLPELGDRAIVLIFNQNHQVIEVQAEVAKTEEQRRKGLMWRKELGENEGMLFIFPYSAHHQFWMKNTLIPLDMIFIGEDFLIKGIIKNTIPESTEPLGISEPSKYVLEVNAGFCQKNQIQKGDKVQFIMMPERK